MAIKFSQFNVAATTADIDYLVGYKSTDNVQIPVSLVGANTTYTVSTAQSGANELITLTGSDSSTDSITITAGTNITLTDDGAGNGFTISATDNVNTYTLPVTGGASAATLTLTGSGGDADPVTITAGTDISFSALTGGGFTIDSTATGDTYTLGTSTNGSSVDVNLDAATGTDSAITLTPGTGMSITQAANIATITNTAPDQTVSLTGGTDISVTGTYPNFTIDSTATGDTYTLSAGTKVGTSVPLVLDAAVGTDSTVNLTEGAGITLTQTSATEITISSAAGVTITKDQFTGNGSTAIFTLSVSVSSADNINIFISGVYQNSLDSAGVANYSVSGTTLTFATAPPVTATNGIEVVITQ